jgi:hypothetical protein
MKPKIEIDNVPLPAELARRIELDNEAIAAIEADEGLSAYKWASAEAAKYIPDEWPNMTDDQRQMFEKNLARRLNRNSKK